MSQELEREYLFIPDEEGNEEKFEIIYEFEVEGKKYLLVIPADSDEEDEEAEVLAFRYEEDGQDMRLFPIEDDEEWDLVEEVFNTLDYEFN
ncbi:DUF1292 domain-containing protein [Tepidibacillus marianensis]|uniref:DUF1292 domain-containing protein n=1 Tax=Tepidibacillus marianensis TaxID=3131995 RepID=UPI0030D2E7E9